MMLMTADLAINLWITCTSKLCRRTQKIKLIPIIALRELVFYIYAELHSSRHLRRHTKLEAKDFFQILAKYRNLT